ncbi:receptor-type tyrosine-protein phosphatase eta-like [Polyodon spathula]|uniref:receptor-type tyrosine-protein phosphatase eta-like n=1 Tax=Polyodon spathula TaxID=7913 RepID=UPI001B7E7DD4|nr:receptor-type tyrosine-protein phosphatase eta-like [Polyodon spathula]
MEKTLGVFLASCSGQRSSHLIRLSKTWYEAQLYCRSCYTDLVTVTPQNEPVLDASTTDTWIGLHRIPGGWQWSDGDGSSYYNWAPGEPNNSGGYEDCATRLTNNNWNDRSCTSKLYFHCYEDSYIGLLSIPAVTPTSLTLSWNPAPGLVDHYRIAVSGQTSQTFTVNNQIAVVTSLTPGCLYTVQVFPVKCVKDLHPASTSVYTAPSPPGQLMTDSVGPNFVSLSWGSPAGMDKIPHSFNITYCSSFWDHHGSTTAASNSTVIYDLRPASQYVFNITTVQDNGNQSVPASASFFTTPSPPGQLISDSVGTNSVSLSWGSPVGMDKIPHSFFISYSSSLSGHNDSIISDSTSTVISDLRPGSEYVFCVTTMHGNGGWSSPVLIFLSTSPSTPGQLMTDSVGPNSVSLSWGSPAGMDKIPHSFNITYCSSFWGHHGSTTAASNSTVISNLKSGSEYVFNVTTVQEHGGRSTPASISLFTSKNSSLNSTPLAGVTRVTHTDHSQFRNISICCIQKII